jgi:hypothetical protein
MTMGVTPDRETADLPVRRFEWSPESAHPPLQGHSILTEVQETIARERSDEVIQAGVPIVFV